MGCLLLIVFLLLGAVTYVYTQGDVILVQQGQSVKDDVRHGQQVDQLFTSMRTSHHR